MQCNCAHCSSNTDQGFYMLVPSMPLLGLVGAKHGQHCIACSRGSANRGLGGPRRPAEGFLSWIIVVFPFGWSCHEGRQKTGMGARLTSPLDPTSISCTETAPNSGPKLSGLDENRCHTRALFMRWSRVCQYWVDSPSDCARNYELCGANSGFPVYPRARIWQRSGTTRITLHERSRPKSSRNWGLIAQIWAGIRPGATRQVSLLHCGAPRSRKHMFLEIQPKIDQICPSFARVCQA